MPSKPIHEFFPGIPDDTRRGDHWWKNFSISWSTTGTHTGNIVDSSPTLAQVLYQNKKDEDGRYLSQHNAGIRQNATLSWNYSMFNWLKLGNSLTYTDAIMDRDRNGKSPVHAYAYNTSSTASFTLYGMRRFQNKPIIAMRHIVTPSAGFRYSPDFSEKNSHTKYYSFGSISVPAQRKQRMINMGLDQKWQFRLRPGADNRARYLNDLITHRISTSYDLEKSEKHWNDFTHSVGVNPGSYEIFGIKYSLSQSYSATQKPYENWNISSWRMATSLNISGDAVYYDYFPIKKNNFVTGNFFPTDTLSVVDQQIFTIHDIERLETPGSWSASSSHDYSYNRRNKSEQQNLRNSASVRLTQNWSMNYNNYYDIKKSTLMSQSLTVNRDLHCWKINFIYTKSADFWDYRVVLFNTRLPDSLRLQTRDNSR
jgi:hypothetical protein